MIFFCCFATLMALAAVVVNIVISTNVLKPDNFSPTTGCFVIHAPGAVGLEDGDLLSKTSALFSASDRAHHQKHPEKWSNRKAVLKTAEQGDFFRYAAGKLEKVSRDDSAAPTLKLHPHGVCTLLSDDGVQLFAVNHQFASEDIVIYDYDESSNSAVLREVVNHPLFTNLNDVKAISKNEFYTTVWETAQFGTLQGTVEVLTQRPWTHVIRCARASDAAAWACDIAADGLVGANGVNLSLDNKYLMISQPSISTIRVYKRAQDGSLTFDKDVDAIGGIDNLHVDPFTGQIFGALHYKLLKFIAHADDPVKNRSPTMVVELMGDLSGPEEQLSWKQHYFNDEFSGGAVGVPVDGRLLVGAVFEQGLLSCPLQ